MVEGTEAVKEAKKFVDKHKPCPTCGRKQGDLIITDVPEKTIKEFRKLADEHFKCPTNKGGHWGFTLKALVDHFIYRVPDGLDELANRISSIEEALETINAELDKEPEEKQIRTVNGKPLRLGGNKNG